MAEVVGADQVRRRKHLPLAYEGLPGLCLEPHRVAFEAGHRKRRISRQPRVTMAILEHHEPPTTTGAHDLVRRIGHQYVLPVGFPDPHEYARHPPGAGVDGLDVDDLVSVAEFLEPARHEQPVLGFPSRLVEQRRLHRGHVGRNEQRQDGPRDREPCRHLEDPLRDPPYPDSTRSEGDDLVFPVETAQARGAPRRRARAAAVPEESPRSSGRAPGRSDPLRRARPPRRRGSV